MAREFSIADLKHITLDELQATNTKLHKDLLNFCSELDQKEFPEATVIAKGKTKSFSGFGKIYEKLLKNKKEKNAQKKLKQAERIILSMAGLKHGGKVPTEVRSGEKSFLRGSHSAALAEGHTVAQVFATVYLTKKGEIHLGITNESTSKTTLCGPLDSAKSLSEQLKDKTKIKKFNCTTKDGFEAMAKEVRAYETVFSYEVNLDRLTQNWETVAPAIQRQDRRQVGEGAGLSLAEKMPGAFSSSMFMWHLPMPGGLSNKTPKEFFMEYLKRKGNKPVTGREVEKTLSTIDWASLFPSSYWNTDTYAALRNNKGPGTFKFEHEGIKFVLEIHAGKAEETKLACRNGKVEFEVKGDVVIIRPKLD